MSSVPTKPICLLGFMGAGKSRWGKQLANKLKLSFVDLDRLVETKSGMTVSDIFIHQGEAFFRQLESECLKDVLSQNGLVVSLGGGTPCTPENMKILNEKALTVYLKANAGMLHSRLAINYKSRPLLSKLQSEALLPFIEKLLAQREPFYHQADVIVNVEGLTLEKLSAAISQGQRTEN